MKDWLEFIGKDRMFLIWKRFIDSLVFSLLILGLVFYFFYENLESFIKREVNEQLIIQINNKDIFNINNINKLFNLKMGLKENQYVVSFSSIKSNVDIRNFVYIGNYIKTIN